MPLFTPVLFRARTFSKAWPYFLRTLGSHRSDGSTSYLNSMMSGTMWWSLSLNLYPPDPSGCSDCAQLFWVLVTPPGRLRRSAQNRCSPASRSGMCRLSHISLNFAIGRRTAAALALDSCSVCSLFRFSPFTWSWTRCFLGAGSAAGSAGGSADGSAGGCWDGGC